MKVREILAKSILNKSFIGDYCINPYIGCLHACNYCYAYYYTRKIYGIDERWGSYVLIKYNAINLLKKEILKKDRGIVYLSSLTDSYQPIEKKYSMTRKILELLLKHNYPLIIQTKSTLILRDFDLIKEFENSQIGFTIVTLDEKIRKKIEPLASPSIERINVLRRFHEEGIKTFAFIGPILPFTPIEKIAEIVDMVSFSDRIYFDKFNYKPGLEKMVEKTWLSEEVKKYYEKIGKDLKEKFDGKKFVHLF
ncbi:MAG: radical SAM protein [Candidatus Aenigmatarchaeota archaeon]